MKALASLLLALTALTVLSGCAGEGYYTPSQRAAQQSGYDPTARTYSRTHY